MRHLYQIDDNGATYWVVSGTPEQAIVLVKNQEDRDDFGDDPHLDYPLDHHHQDVAKRIRFHLDGEEESCSMWFAYLLVRESGDQILACSEWP